MSSTLVPMVDLSTWTSARPADRALLAAAVDDACRRVGFLQVVGHGIPPATIAAALEASDRFFALPLEDKLRVRPPSPDVNRGYAALGTEALAYSLGRTRPPDLFEAFNIGSESAPAGVPPPSLPVFAPNIWPDVDGFRAALWNYFLAAHRASEVLLEVFAEALGLAPGWFAASTDHSTLAMRTIRYERPAGAAEPEPGQQRMGEHTDYGVVTVLYADPVPGLQIIDDAGRWHDVVPEPGALLVNLGDLLAQWTNDRWRSTVHRVVPPPASAGPARRRSMAFFNDANFDAVVTCLPTCTSPDNPPRYPSVVAVDHLAEKLLGPRALRPAQAADTVGARLAADTSTPAP